MICKLKKAFDLWSVISLRVNVNVVMTRSVAETKDDNVALTGDLRARPEG